MKKNDLTLLSLVDERNNIWKASKVKQRETRALN
jgi:hypothetical protein